MDFISTFHKKMLNTIFLVVCFKKCLYIPCKVIYFQTPHSRAFIVGKHVYLLKPQFLLCFPNPFMFVFRVSTSLKENIFIFGTIVLDYTSF